MQVPIPEIDLTVYPDECDAFGHLNQASFLSLFERARWEMLARGPGMDVFTRAGAWPAVRKTVIDYHAAAFPGDVLRFQQALTHHGRTSFTMRQTARRLRDDTLIATAEFVFVCISREGRPVPVPEEVGRFMNARSAGSDVQRLTVNGVSLAVDVRGAGEPALLLIHGYAADRTMWQHQMNQLDTHLRLAPDLRGMGQSDAPDLGYSMTTYADDLAALLDALGIDTVVLCGCSLGGYIAFEFVRRFRDRVRGLILVDSRAEGDTPDGRRQRDTQAQQVRERGPAAVADALLPKLFADAVHGHHSAAAESVRRMILASPPAGIVGALAAMRDRPDSTPMLATLGSIPSLVIVGDGDRITPEAGARAMAEAIPGARIAVIADAGHMSPVEQPAAVTEAIRGFLQQL